MSRRPKPVPFSEADLVTGELRQAPRSRRWLTTSVVIVLLVLVAAVAYAVIFAPDHYAQWRAERLTGDSTVEIGGEAETTPGDGWIAQPRVTNLVEWPPLPPLRNWAVLTGAETGVELLSPDRGLSVELFVDAGSANADADWLAQVADEGDGEQKPTLLTETLSSGAELIHADAPEEIRAVVSIGGTKVRMLASTTPDAEKLTGEGSAPEGAHETTPIDPYRPALSALLESLTAG